MKKFLVTILAFLYISSTIGATLHMHYCMGKLADSGLMGNSATLCSNCGMQETGNGCCRHEQKFVKNDTDQKTTESGFQFIQLISFAPHPFFEEALYNNFPAITLVSPINHPPSRNCGIAFYIRNCVFRI
ncbi:MAG: hypothetical protein IPN43_11205 [Chitinophagaceae bacterium]|jgi:hypothetical protein|nr:hypothetical protein [Chitinophagaceae bacterium]